MASKQTRRSISVSMSLYEKLKVRCDAENLSMSGVVETEIRKYLGMEPRDLTPKPAPKRVSTTVLVAKELAPRTDWQPVPAARMEEIKRVAEKSNATIAPLGDKASKIFTF